MRRSEFVNSVNDWYAFMHFCDEENRDYDWLYDNEGRDEAIRDEIYDRYNNGDSWEDISEYLSSLYSSGDDDTFWRKDDYGDWSQLDDDDLEHEKEIIIEDYDEYGYWDPEDDDDTEDNDEHEQEVDDFEEPVEPDPTPDEEIGILSLGVYMNDLQTLNPKESESDRSKSEVEDDEFEELRSLLF